MSPSLPTTRPLLEPCDTPMITGTGPKTGFGVLRSLVHHASAVDHDAPLEQVHRTFADRQVEYLALVRNGIVTGLCSRLRVGMLFGSRYGFALYSRSPAHQAQVQRPLVFGIHTPVREVLDRALSRPGDEFNEDVVLIDEHHALIGLIRVDALARLQSQLVSEQVAEMRRQHEELRHAHEALRQSQGRYTGLFDNPAIGVALLDERGTVHAINPRLAEIFHLGAAASAVASLLPWIDETDRATFRALLEAQRHQGGAATRELTFNVPERGARVLRCSVGWIPATDQICACFDDVTEQRQMERQLLRQEKQILLDTLVGGIAHELNNKLTPVQGFSDLISATGGDDVGQYADLISKSVAEAAHIIRQLLQLSRPTASVTTIVDLRAVLAEALTMLRFQIRETRCHLKVAEPAGAVWVRVDPAEIKQVIMNLALNALHAMAHRTHAVLEIGVDAVEGRARLSVVDNGIGIPPENIDRIFDPFFTTKSPERGSGLGLSICFSIIRRHAGTIDVTSEPGAGATFTVSLPLERAPAFVAPALVPANPPRPAVAPSNDLRVLVVEDEPHVRRLIQTVLTTRFGCDVDIAVHGVDAFERLAVQRYALVISDIRMPAMNGTELYLWLREAQPLTAQRFIFVTGYPGEYHLEKEISQWNIPVLPKPFSVSRLCELCAPYLEVAVATPAAG